WHQVAFNLSAYKGQKVKLAFIGTSDAEQSDQSHQSAVTYHGMWYLDNIAVDTVTAGGTSGRTFFEDCESGMGNWRAHGKVPQYYWHRSTRRANSPVTAWWNGNESTGVYKWGQSDAVTSPIINLTEVRNTDPCYVDFKVWCDIPDDGKDLNKLNDWYKVELSGDSGRNWVDNYGIGIDSSKVWRDNSSIFTQVNLTNYVGKTVMVRVGFGSDGDNNVGEGMYMDDFIVWGKTREPLPSASTICLVDNDGNAADISDNSWTKYMESSLANLGYKYSLVTIGSNKLMTPGYLEQYPLVIWNLGSNFDFRTGAIYKALTIKDQECILSYLNNGGNMWMSGQYFFFANGTQLDTTVHPNIWMDYLHLAPENGWAATTTYQGYGVAGDPIGGGLADSLLYDRLNGNAIWTGPDRAYSLNPDSANYPVVGFMMNDDSTFNGLRYYDAGLGYNLVYTSFPYEAVSSPEKRDTLMARVINSLKPGLNGDYIPPAVPQGLILAQSYDTVKCVWLANSEADVKGYNVYRSLQSGIPAWIKLGTVLHPDTVFADTTVQAGLTYNYALTAYDTLVPANESLKSLWSRITVTAWKLGIEGLPVSVIPARFSLEQNKPNPFTGNTEIRFALPAASRVELGVYNVAGQKVSTLASGDYPAGYHSIRWNGKDGQGRMLSNGVYFYRLEARGQNGQERLSQTKRLIIVK
ncbi:MAG: FlgD immunoglobulin-like domain containing protein, partial [bacterium]|nr:FlgD immunoglobulin-like domain containing protein [bacterium]